MAPLYQEYKDPGTRMSFFTHATPRNTLESSKLLTKKYCSCKSFTQLDFLTLELLHTIDIWHADIVHKKTKTILGATQIKPSSTSYVHVL